MLWNANWTMSAAAVHHECVCVRASLGAHTRDRIKRTRAKRTSFAADREAEFLFEKGEFGSVAGDLVRESGALFRFDCGAGKGDAHISQRSTGRRRRPRKAKKEAHVLAWRATSPESL